MICNIRFFNNVSTVKHVIMNSHQILPRPNHLSYAIYSSIHFISTMTHLYLFWRPDHSATQFLPPNYLRPFRNTENCQGLDHTPTSDDREILQHFVERLTS